MTQDMNHTIVNALRAVLMGALMFVTGTNAMAQESSETPTGVVVHGNVYGGGNQAGVLVNTAVNMSIGQVDGNVYGGGKMGDVGTIYKPNGSYDYTWKNSEANGDVNDTNNNHNNTAGNNTITGTNKNTGICTVNITGGTIGVQDKSTVNHASGHVFGAGKGSDDTWWCEKAIAFATNVSISGASTVVYGNVYGGGEVGRVEDDAKVVIGTSPAGGSTNAPDIKGDVYGAGAGIETHGYSALVRGNAAVTVQGAAHVGGSVYGGGEIASVGKFEVVGGLPTKPKTGGTCLVNIKDNAIIGTSGSTGHNVFGACKGVTPHYDSSTLSSYKSVYSMQLYENRPSDTPGDTWDYWITYEDGYNGQKFIKRYYKTETEYLAFLKTLALTSNPHVTIGGTWTPNETTGTITASGTPSVYGSVYGGGQMGVTLGSVDVNIVGGTVEEDVYGGGALADTNLGNWDVNGYVVATALNDGESITDLYTRTESDGKYTYTKITDSETEFVSGTYYRQEATWAHTEGSAYYKTTVDLTGGTIKGDAYGGGLGQKTGFNDAQGVSATKDVEAVVWGDINVTLGSNGGSATSFYTTYEKDNDNNDVLKSGRVFGCNNLLGSPQGDVTVTVWTTVDGKDDNGETITKTAEADKSSTEETVHTYRLAAVYGGGNLASYEASGKKAHVIIHGCSDTSILTVYGGGNAAAVPETDVDVYSAYEIGALFGGGNGKDKYKKGNTWQINPGADVNGNANTMVYGGTVHEAYGASNEKGTITGDVAIDVSNVNSDNCPLDVAKIVGAGKNADVNGNLVLIMGCKPGTPIPLVYGGADNANVNGNVELTITSGNFTQVFGGNNAGGAIRGHIKLNIEETGTCDTPITIDQLYLGGNEAAYSIYGYYVKTTTSEGDGGGVGASDETAILKNGKLQFMPRQSATDTHLPVDTYTFDEDQNEWSWTTSSISTFTPYDEPELNVISCTRINNVFGGGFGTGAAMYADPTVNINMIKGHFYNDNTKGVPHVMSELGLASFASSENPNGLGVIGNVYGGGNAADVIGDPTVNIGTAATVDLVSTEQTGVSVLGAYITGNVYGGGKGEAKTTAGTAGEAFLCAKAMVSGDDGTHVNIGNGYVRGNVYGGGQVGRVEHNTEVTIGLADADIPSGGSSAPIINGNVFGAGRGVNTHGYSALVRGHSTVTVQADSKVLGSVYGGGEIASVGKYKVENGLPVALAPDNTHPQSGYCYVTIRGNAEIGPDDMEMTKSGGPSDFGHVFGAGKGVLPFEGYADGAQPFHMNGIQVLVNGEWDGKSLNDAPTSYDAYNASAELQPAYVTFIRSLALATQTVVTIEGNPFIKGSVYGGSENGYVQKDTHVTISGGQIGNGYVQMDDDGNYLATKYSVNRRYSDEEWAAGHLIKDGETNYAHSLPECASWPYGETITVPSGENTTTTKTIYAPYDKYAMITEGHEEEYEVVYDAANNKSTNGGRRQGSDGHTFYGNVFGGGSGYYPYKPGRWFEDAGAVYGNTYVTIKGGHILTSVYGGNEMTDVGKYADNDQLNLTSGGSCYVTMIGGTLGVPRTLKQIEKHPVTCYLFGAGKGDQRVFFNKLTNVGNVYVHISDDARIYGSVFGGGEDGHVMKNVEMNIGGNTLPAVYSSSSTDEVLKALNLTAQGTKPVETSEGTITHPYIGTWGTSYVDGNVFGGGRGFGGDAYTAGNVAGTVTMNIYGGTMLGSIYGGGRLGSVGYGLFDASVTAYYGKMRPDNTTETATGASSTLDNFPRGYVYMTIGKDDGTGPTIGNTHEYIVPNTDSSTGNTPSSITETDFKKWSAADWTAWKNHNHVPNTEYDTTTGRLTHTKGGNVFAGGMGRFYQLDGSTAISAVDWWKLGNVKSTKLTITGGNILSNVYGGGELGMVQGGSHTSEDNKTVSTEIIISGGTIGTDIADYTFGSVFGGGYGSLVEKFTHTGGKPDSYPKYIAGRVKGSTEVTISGSSTVVKASVYGGGEMAAVGESEVLLASTDPVVPGETLTGENGAPVEANTYVIISGGTIGKAKEGTTYFGGAKMGNVYGGGSGHNNTVRSGHIYGNTNVTISDGVIYHNVYGGGAYGSVGDFTYHLDNTTKKVDGISGRHADRTDTGTANVTITGGTIGYDGKENGMVFGSSRGDINRPEERDDYTAWVYDANVIIGTAATGTQGEEGYVAESGPAIKGSVYGSGENGHTFNNTVVTVNGGKIGIDDSNDDGYSVTSNDKTYEGAAYPYRGNVYGGGCGTDKYFSDHTLEDHSGEGDYYNPLAGIVYGTSTVNINDGTVVRNVYGAGAMGSVGKTTWTTTTTGEGEEATTVTTATTAGGSTMVNINGGIIGTTGTVGDGNVFGAARGSKDIVQADYINDLSSVSVTNVNVFGGTVKGNVYGGGELGDVGTIIKNTSDYNYTWQKTGGGANTALNNGITENNTNTGICNVTITGGTIGSSTAGTGNVFGGGKGDANTWWCEKAMAFATNVSVSEASGATTKVFGTVYGGGEIGRVEDDSKVIIGTADGSDTPEIVGSVFGAGKGLATRGYSALVRGNSVVTVQGSAQVGGNVFGGGEEASLGRFNLVKGLPKFPLTGGSATVTIQDQATVGSSNTSRSVYGAGQGVTPNFDSSNYKNYKSMQLERNKPAGDEGDTWDYYIDDDNKKDETFVWVYYKTEPEYQSFLNTLAIASHPTVTIAENATVYGDVYGGGQRGITLGRVDVNITGGTVKQDVYGGGSLADTNKGNWDDDRYVKATVAAGASVAGLYTITSGSGTAESPYVYTPTAANAVNDGSTTYYRKGTWAEGKSAATYTTNVTLTGGVIDRNVYGGGLGQLAKDAVGTSGQEGYVPAVSAVEAKVYGNVLVKLNEDTANDDCYVKGTIFGCNNLNGSPQNDVTVHVYKTVQKNSSGTVIDKPTKNTNAYEVEAVYGGGNLAAYYPDDVDSRKSAVANVIIDGCDKTSIKSVYGGGNAASVPATEVVVNGTYEIGEVFGGGNGLDNYQIDGVWYQNPGANVGLENYTHRLTSSVSSPGTEDNPYYLAENNTDPDTSTRESRSDNYGYGIGKAHATIYGGTVHKVYGGSNTKGNVRVESRTTLEDRGCNYTVGEAYGGGNNAPQDGDAVLEAGCIQGLDIAYGGSSNADVNGDVILNITNGTYGRVFGGNNLGGIIRGTIIVNIEETGCRPIVIGQLYGGGNLAPYTVENIDKTRTDLNFTDPTANNYYKNFPKVNVKSFTSIGTVFGGGFGTRAELVGNPQVNINVYKGKYYNTFKGNDNEIGGNAKVVGTSVKYPADNDAGYADGYPIPSHEHGAIGAINDVFGGGNLAAVIGNPTVNIGTEAGEEVYVAVEVASTITDVKGYYTRTGEGTNESPYAYSEITESTTPATGTTYYLKTVKAVDIRGNVFGGGNNAEVTGNTNVVIGKKTTTTTP